MHTVLLQKGQLHDKCTVVQTVLMLYKTNIVSQNTATPIYKLLSVIRRNALNKLCSQLVLELCFTPIRRCADSIKRTSCLMYNSCNNVHFLYIFFQVLRIRHPTYSSRPGNSSLEHTPNEHLPSQERKREVQAQLFSMPSCCYLKI